MNPVYLVVMIFVTCLLLAIPLFPFCKARARIRTHHPDIWAARGPFDLRSLVSSGVLIDDFLDVLKNAAEDEEMRKADPVLARWAQVSREVIHMLPQSFLGQIGYALCFMYFVALFTKLILSLVPAGV